MVDKRKLSSLEKNTKISKLIGLMWNKFKTFFLTHHNHPCTDNQQPADQNTSLGNGRT